jgi:hypothetical protein
MSSSIGVILGAICGAIFILGFIGAGIFLIYRSVQNRKRAEASQGWPSTVGQINESRVAHSTHTDSEGDSSDSYTPYVTYTYQVAGQAYTGKDITFGFKQGYSNASKAQAVVGKYPLDAQVSVYYDPADPQKAVLERQAGGFGVGLALGIIFLVISACLGCGGVFALVSAWLVPVAQ